MSKRGLGKGLGALIAINETTDQMVKEIPLRQIEPNPAQPRKEFKEENMAELAASLKLHGVLQPILVRPAGMDHYYIIAGERRFRAAQQAGFDRIPCLIQECTDQESAERALIENIQRSELSPLEEGQAYARLIDEYGLTQEQVARRVGKNRPFVTNLLGIIKLPERILDLLRNDKLSVGHLKLFLGLEDSSLQILVAEKAAKDGLSVRATEDLIRNLRDEHVKIANRGQEIIAADPLLNIAQKLSSVMQTKVAVKGNASRGKIQIEYYSKDELNRLLELWRIEID